MPLANDLDHADEPAAALLDDPKVGRHSFQRRILVQRLAARAPKSTCAGVVCDQYVGVVSAVKIRHEASDRRVAEVVLSLGRGSPYGRRHTLALARWRHDRRQL